MGMDAATEHAHGQAGTGLANDADKGGVIAVAMFACPFRLPAG